MEPFNTHTGMVAPATSSTSANSTSRASSSRSGAFVNRNRMLWLVGLGLVTLAAAVFVADIYSGHIEQSSSVSILAIVIAVSGMGVDLWARSSPYVPELRIRPPKHAVLLNLLFVATMLALSGGLVYLTFLNPHSNWRRTLRTVVMSIAFLLAYNLLVVLLRRMRTRSLANR
jgi:hypothetical protein